MKEITTTFIQAREFDNKNVYTALAGRASCYTATHWVLVILIEPLHLVNFRKIISKFCLIFCFLFLREFIAPTPVFFPILYYFLLKKKNRRDVSTAA